MKFRSAIHHRDESFIGQSILLVIFMWIFTPILLSQIIKFDPIFDSCGPDLLVGLTLLPISTSPYIGNIPLAIIKVGVRGCYF